MPYDILPKTMGLSMRFCPYSQVLRTRYQTEVSAEGVCAAPPSAAVTFAAKSPSLAYSQSPGQLLLANQRWTVSTISSDFGA